MSAPRATRFEERALVLAPTGRDAALTCALLAEAGMDAEVCQDMAEVCQRILQEGALALLVAEEALMARALAQLSGLLSEQPAWSDLPILLFTGRLAETSPSLSRRAIETLGNVTLLERPLRPVTMLSAANAARRARRRQYLMRDELKAQREQVRQRDQFLAMLGHELRNPLSAITMAAALESEGSAPQYKAIVARQARHLTRLVDDLLDVARVTTGKIVLQRAPLDVGDLTRRALFSMRGLIEQHQLALEVYISSEALVVHADSVRIEQVLINLLNNAIKYTPTRGRIEVSVHAHPAEIEIRVRDSGVGIATEMLSRVFDLFAQAEGTLDRADGGMGIGLTLVKRLVELHGGSVHAESDGLGSGSTFVVQLPRLLDVEAHQNSWPSPAWPERRTREVLIIEDNDDSRELLASMLRRRGHKVIAACDGRAGVELALAQRPNALLVDIGLPGLDGYAVAREVRRALGRDALMIAVTGYGQPEDKARALEAGFDVHLTKPLDPHRLEQLLTHEALGAQQAAK